MQHPAIEAGPAAVLAQQLADARARGERFEQAWPAGLEVALAGETSREKQAWEAVFGEQVDVWCRAFARRPGPGLRRTG
jgi:hypothetical protein